MTSASPRKSDVLVAIGLAFEPLLPIDPGQTRWFGEQLARPLAFVPDAPPEAGRPPAWRLNPQEVRLRLEDLRQILDDFHRRLEVDAPSPDVRMLADTLLHRVDEDLARMMRVDVPRLSTPDEALAAESLRTGLARVQLTVLNIPRIDYGMERELSAARGVYQSRFWWICVSMAAAVLLFGLVIHCGYRWIFVPIRRLHQGASRVAQGDFGYRVQVSGTDEMAQLADKFNQMTARFEEIRDELDGEVRQRTKQALRSERLAGVGFLASGVAHEINNPLSAIAMAAESLEGRIHSAEEAGGLCRDDLGVLTQYLGMIQREAFRCQQITQRLLDFSRGQDVPRSRHDVVKIIGEVLDMVGHMSKFRGHEIVFDRQTPVYAEVNPSELKQVVLNLVANALESMEGRGRLEIRAAEQSDEVLLTFRDSGCGMTPHVLENLFEPFFTEKKSGRGTGLGLSISHRIVTDHGGRIEALSDGPGQGSLFRVHLPRQAARKRAA
ncbi:MAG TPA: HAMP domain-containing sensor histidine kinase, partial [Planctomycetaceae bacterium]|nr:HAMP domain-containing sensor histidine kinase [Planctomycetaceae bacterium]